LCWLELVFLREFVCTAAEGGGFDTDVRDGGRKGCEGDIGILAEICGVTKASERNGVNTDAWTVVAVVGFDLLAGVAATLDTLVCVLGFTLLPVLAVDLLALGVVMGALRILTTPPRVVPLKFLLAFVPFESGVIFLAGRDSCAITLCVTGEGELPRDLLVPGSPGTPASGFFISFDFLLKAGSCGATEAVAC